MSKTVAERVRLAFLSRKRPLTHERLHNHRLLRRELGSTVRTRCKEAERGGKVRIAELAINSRGRVVAAYEWIGR